MYPASAVVSVAATPTREATSTAGQDTPGGASGALKIRQKNIGMRAHSHKKMLVPWILIHVTVIAIR